MSTDSMPQLHAYWRMEYIEAPKPLKEDPDLFENLPKSQDDEQAAIIARNEHSYIVLNRYPYNAGHLLIVPYRPVADLADLSQDERADLFNSIIQAQEILKKALKPQGFNTGFNFGAASGAGIPKHIHCHVVPRWSGDTNFMPVIGNTKVLPQSLKDMWKRLRHCVS